MPITTISETIKTPKIPNRTDQRMANPLYHHLYKTARWHRRRERQLEQHPLCCICERDGRVTPANVADHVEPHRGDLERFYYGALQSLCPICHSAVKQAEEHGAIRGAQVNGMPLDPSHPWNTQG